VVLCARVLPDEAAHSQYEMRSFMRSDSGILYPTGQGRLADPTNPAPLPNTLPYPTTPVPGNVPGVLPKAARPKPVKEKPKGRSSTAKTARVISGHAVPGATAYLEGPSTGVVIPERPAVVAKEDHKARQSRLDTYDDAIESVLRRVQETDQDDIIYEQIVSDFGRDDEPFVPPTVAAGERSAQDRVAQIADTIDAVIARTFHDSDQSPSPPPPPPVGSPPPCDDEDEIIEVHSVSPLRVEVTTDDVLILPPPSPPAEFPVPVRTLADRKILPEEASKVPTSRRSRKPKKPAFAVAVEDDFGQSGDWPPVPEVPSQLKHGITDSYVKLEELPASVRRGEQIADVWDEEDRGQPLPMDVAESLMELARVAPPLKRLRISYGSGRDRTTEDTNGEDVEIYEHGIDDVDLVNAERSTTSDLLTLDNRQRSDHERNRTREAADERAELPDVLTDVVEPAYYEKPAGKKGRPRKDQKKRSKAQKAAVHFPPLIVLYF